ncbi:putative beta-lysine N-acetyltransferase [Paenibacillus chondroitinus]|uniref:Beta-lysine N-acetyltransferase n=1 Tax=Paenibacillus chondroitinus TaxID=59842 RepID=A0ABU6DPK3_9BACL|nr:MULTISPECIES: putative beta-lysine N-acetyltransferase [Paenibacillus]MCY9663055.1 putative beta-lysine N-acetyltransferase [Paenibacillus anseongense]MEB4798722.1 putative beta-lysine N-acetyltransferase [Paenibacillus chondroitinus]
MPNQMPNDRPTSRLEVESGSDYTVSFYLDFMNKRLRVDDYQGNVDAIYERAAYVAKSHALTKVFIKSREQDWQSFLGKGCMLEGIYKGYFHGMDAYCMAFYYDLGRRSSDYWMEEDSILHQVLALSRKSIRPVIPEPFTLRLALPKDAEQLSQLYSQIFQTYPTPMNDPLYVAKTMQEGTIYYLVESQNELISAASAEINATYANAEMTDCATLPAFRNKGLMRLLMHALEDELIARQITCAYSLSRALSFGMNAVFHQMGYGYYGRLTKNCDIYDKYEDMNLWAKTLIKP